MKRINIILIFLLLIISINPVSAVQVYATDTLRYSNDSQVVFTNGAYQLKKQITTEYNITGTIRAKFDLCAGTDQNSYGQIWADGAIIGSEQTVAAGDYLCDSFKTITENITVSNNHIIQLYAYSTGGVQGKLQNFRVYYSWGENGTDPSYPSAYTSVIDDLIINRSVDDAIYSITSSQTVATSNFVPPGNITGTMRFSFMASVTGGQTGYIYLQKNQVNLTTFAITNSNYQGFDYTPSLILNRTDILSLNISTTGGTISVKNFTLKFGKLDAPVNNTQIYYNYPPISSTQTFSWSMTDSQFHLKISRDKNHDLNVVDTTVSTNTSSQLLEAGTYYWKVGVYNSSTGTYTYPNNSVVDVIANTTVVIGTGIKGIIYELVNEVKTPVDGATVFMYNTSWSSTQITGSNGYYLFNSLTNNSLYYIKTSKKGYEDSELQTVNTSTGGFVTQDILIEKCVSGYNCFYDQKYVTFRVQSPTGTVYSGVTVTIYKNDDITSSYTGTTGTDGSYTELLFIAQRYRITFVKASQNINEQITISVQPKGTDDSYTIMVWGSPIVDRADNITWSFPVLDNNATTTWLNLTYASDTSTTTINFWVKNGSTGNYIYSTSTTGVTSWSIGYPVDDSNNKIYVWGFNATHPTWGNFSHSTTHRFRSGYLIDLGITDTRYYTWFSIGFLTLMALLFSGTTKRYGFILIPLFALFTWSIGWFPQGYNVSHFTLIMTTLVLGVLAYLRTAEKKSAGGYFY